MKRNHLLIALVLFTMLLPGCGAKEAPVIAVAESTQAGDLTGLKECESIPVGSETKDAAQCDPLVVPENQGEASTTDEAEHAQEKAALQNLLDQQVKRQGILGMVMAVRLADGAVIWATSGYTDPSGKERWTANTASLIASVTKTFTAVVVMQLVEEGKLSLDDTVDTWFPEQPSGDKITVRMLLSHTSGLAGFSSTWGTDLDKWSRDWTPEDLIAEANKVGPVGVPGSSVAHYSNTN